MSDITPMMRQYYKIKEKYRDAILLFRVGDFYETFGEDAKIASKELNIVLTSSEKGKGKRIPMAGVPFHAVSTYIRQLIRKGYKVAICEQIGDKGKEIVKREVVRLITPGTIIEDSFLEERSSNYLMCANIVAEKVGIAIVDVSTGEFSLTEFEDDDAHSYFLNEIVRIKPAEIVFPESFSLDIDKWRFLNTGININGIEKIISRYDDYYFDYKNAYATLINHFRVISLDGFGCSELKTGIGTAGAVISYLKDTQKKVLANINMLKTFFISNYMVLDGVTLRNLEIFRNIRDGTQRGTLIGILDKTKTSMGSRLLNKNLGFPLLDIAEIKRRQEALKELYADILLRESIKEILNEIYDIERIISRITYGNANARDLVLLKKSLSEVTDLKEVLKGCKAEKTRDISKALKDFSDVVDLLDRSIVEEPPPPVTVKEGGIIKEKFNEELDELRRIKHEGRKWLADFEGKEKRWTGIKSLKVGYNKVFGYYIEVTKSYTGKVPSSYIRKQTLTDAERYITKELKEYETKALSAEERIKGLEYELFEGIRKEIVRKARDIQEVANSIAEIDMLLSLAAVAAENGYYCPEVNEGNEIYIKEGRHPVVEKEVRGGFVQNDIFLSNTKNQLMIITGPNMSGKSTFMRQAALIVLLAQIGSFVPAKEAKIGVVDRIFTRVGAYDDLSMGQSSFMVEMSETANILNNATEKSLIILDEIGRGTSTLDGLSIAWSVAEYVHRRIRAKTMFATHFHELTELADSLDGAKCYNVSIKEIEEEIFFIRKVVEGRGSKSYGIQVAKLAGLPTEVIESAKVVLRRMESEVGKKQEEKEVKRDKEEKKVEVEKEYVVQEHPVVKELKTINLEKISPIEALNMLYEMKKKILNG